LFVAAVFVEAFASLFDYYCSSVKMLQLLPLNSAIALRADTTSVSASGDHATFARWTEQSAKVICLTLILLIMHQLVRCITFITDILLT